MPDINWHPPALVFMYSGGLYCPDCASEIEHDLIGQGLAMCQGSDDSNTWPVSFSASEGETDTPDHCSTMDCQRFLGRRLTSEGIEYVKEQVRDLTFMALPEYYYTVPSYEIVRGWCDCYGIDLESIDGYYGVDGIDLASAVGIESETEGK